MQTEGGVEGVRNQGNLWRSLVEHFPIVYVWEQE